MKPRLDWMQKGVSLNILSRSKGMEPHIAYRKPHTEKRTTGTGQRKAISDFEYTFPLEGN